MQKNVDEIVAALEVKVVAVTDDDLRLIGATAGTRARRRSRAQA